MNKKQKTVLKSFFILLAFTLAIKSGAVWMPPTLSAPDGNTQPPVNVGDVLQFKNGNFVAQGLKSTVSAIFEGNLQILVGTPGEGKVLTSDATGIASWQTPANGGGGEGSDGNGWTDEGVVVRLTTFADDINIGNSTLINKEGVRFLHNRGGPDSTYLGINAGTFSSGGAKENTGIGKSSLSANTSGKRNSALGYNSLLLNTSGENNTAIGWTSLLKNTSGDGNTAVGTGTMTLNEVGNDNTAVGQFALAATTSSNNTAVGKNALSANQTGIQNTAIGALSDFPAGTSLNNSTVIGFGAIVNASNKVRIGNTNVEVIEGQVDWSFPSDIRIKKNIKDSNLGLDFINKLRPVSFQRVNGDDLINYGFIAQEVEQVLNGVDTSIVLTDSTPEKMKTMRYTQLIAPIVKGMQELKTENDLLKKENTELKIRMDAIELKLNNL
ncbi:MAG: trimeric autotransporter adhesin [Patescibacteria group bacterium]|nr:trimeric autotransporter adhesin [Patescibacteria group bacterium]